MRLMLCCFLILMLSTLSVHAASPSIDLDKLSLADIEKLPKDQLDQLPIIEMAERAAKANPSKAMPVPALIFGIETALYELRFYPRLPRRQMTPELVDAIKGFQTSIGAAPTGRMLVGEFDRLNAHASFVQRPRFAPLTQGRDQKPDVFMFEDTWLKANGTWIIVGDEIDHPINVSEIRCERREGICREARARVQFPSTKWGDFYLWMESEVFEVLTWSKDEVLARRDFTCRSELLRMNPKSNLAERVVLDKQNPDCPPELRLERPRIARLTHGNFVAQKFNMDQWEKKLPMFAPAYQEQLRAIQEEYRQRGK